MAVAMRGMATDEDEEDGKKLMLSIAAVKILWDIPGDFSISDSFNFDCGCSKRIRPFNYKNVNKEHFCR